MKHNLAILLSIFCVSFCAGTSDDSVSPFGRKPSISFVGDNLPQAHSILLYVIVLEGLHALGLDKPDSMSKSAQSAALFSGILGVFSVLQNREFRPSDRMEQLNPVDYEWIYEIVEKLSKKARITMPKIWFLDDLKTNKELNLSAFVSSLQPALVLSQDMVSTFTRDELEAVIAHEIMHIASYDIHTKVFLETIAQGIYCQLLFLQYHYWRELFRREKQPKEQIRQVVVYSTVAVINFFFFALIRAFSRYRESCADWYGVEMTGNPEALIRALDKLGHNGAYERESRESMLQRLFATHPRITNRLERLRTLCHKIKQNLLHGTQEIQLCQ